jgi:hypothetical protein
MNLKLSGFPSGIPQLGRHSKIGRWRSRYWIVDMYAENRGRSRLRMRRDALMNFLEQQSGGKGTAPGYSFPDVPATVNLTIGGVLAINGHGTAIAVHGEDICTSYGSPSNRILAFRAVVTDPVGAMPTVMRFVS